jgi:FkbM family methyltransferase
MHRIVKRLNCLSFVDSFAYTARHGIARGLRRQGGLGWLPSFVPRTSEWNAEEAFARRLFLRGQTVYDVGGDQGLYAIFFADRVGERGQVVVFEPNPASCRRIRRNAEINGLRNIRIVPMGLGERRERLPFTVPVHEPARGTAVPSIASHIRNEVRALLPGMEIEVVALDEEIPRSGLPRPDFIKLDVEGMEYPALKGMSRTLAEHRPRLSIEIHGADRQEKVDNVRRVVALLEGLGYRIRHIESGTAIDGTNADLACEGHLDCERERRTSKRPAAPSLGRAHSEPRSA